MFFFLNKHKHHTESFYFGTSFFSQPSKNSKKLVTLPYSHSLSLIENVVTVPSPKSLDSKWLQPAPQILNLFSADEDLSPWRAGKREVLLKAIPRRKRRKGKEKKGERGRKGGGQKGRKEWTRAVPTELVRQLQGGSYRRKNTYCVILV